MRDIMKRPMNLPRRAGQLRAWVAAGALAATAACGDGATAVAACPQSGPISMGIKDTVYVTLGGVVRPEVTVVPECKNELLYHYDPALLAVEGDSVRARGYGVARFAAQVGPRGVMAWIAVVPPGTLSATSLRSIHLLSTDLARRDSTVVSEHGGRRVTAWSPTGAIAFTDARGLRVIDGPSTAPRDLLGPIAGVDYQDWPRYSADGQWVYFVGSAEPYVSQSSLWRARADGSSPRVLLASQEASSESTPDPSPDGRRVAFASTRGNDPNGFDYGLKLQILDLQTRAITNLRIEAAWPRWSPRGDRLAYVARGVIYVVNPDGTGKRRVSSLDRRYGNAADNVTAPVAPMVDWSPDGEWLVVREATTGLDLIQVSTGLTIPLRGTGNLTLPAWRR